LTESRHFWRNRGAREPDWIGMTSAGASKWYISKRDTMKSGKNASSQVEDAPPAAAREPVAKVFWSGRSQAVRLPKEFRVEDTELKITRVGNALVLQPTRAGLDRRGWPEGFFDIFGGAAAALDLGDRSAWPERFDPLGGADDD